MKSAVVGLGRIGATFENDPYREKPASHVGAINTCSGVELTAVADISKTSRVAFKKNFPSIPTYNSLETMLQNHSIHALHIATPTRTHSRIFRQALAANLPLVVLEKPIADNLSEALKMEKLLSCSTTKVVVNHERRFATNYAEVKSYVKNETFGKLQSIVAALSEETTTKPYEVLLHDGTHMIDVVRFLCGANSFNSQSSLQNVPYNVFESGEIKLRNVESYENMLHLHYLQKMGFGNKSRHNFYVPCTFEISSRKKYFQFELKLFFENGVIDIGNGIFNVWKSMPSKLYKGFRSLQISQTAVKKTQYFSGMVKHSRNLFLGKEAPCSSFADGMSVMQLCQAVKTKLE